MRRLRVWLIGPAVVLVAVAAFVVFRSQPPEPFMAAPATTSPSVVRVLDRQKVGDRGEQLSVHSVALGRATPVRVLLPKGWVAGSGPWPVLYLLNGCCGSDNIAWIERGGVDRLTVNVPIIVVIPEGGPVGFYSDWVRGPKWETYHLTELLPLIEAEFGAMGYAARHPGTFSSGNGKAGPLDPPGTTGDFEDALLSQSKAFARQARAAGVRITIDFYGPGRHTWPYWERALKRAMPVLRAAVGA